jgi:uncharacterized protein YdaU (DUF1376 family)
MNWYKHYLGDYARDTAHLSVTEHGAYRLLIDHYYALRKPLPDDFAYLCRVARCHSRYEKSCLRTILTTYFEIINHHVTHSRIDQEILKYQQIVDASRKANAIRWQSVRISPPEVRSQKLEESKSNTYAAHQKPQRLGAAHKINGDDSPILAKLPLREGGEYEIRQSFVAQLEPIYPDVDVVRTLAEMRGWCLGNPDRTKTRRGIKRFITNWLQNEQDKGDA